MQDYKEAACHSTSFGPPWVSIWTTPAPDFLKVNVDVAWNSLDKVCDHSGAIICCASRRYACCSTILHAELLAIRFGLNQRLNNILLESVSLMAKKELEKGSWLFL